MNHLPIAETRNKLYEVLQKHQNCVLRAPAGSGKSSMVPQYILDDGLAGNKKVVVLQPRRIAARMLAQYVSFLRGTVLGHETGYHIRLESLQCANTRILFVTEGMLVQRLLNGDLLNDVGVIIFDEFHERHLETDLGLALALQLQQSKRPNLKLVVMSATIQTGLVQAIMNGCPVIESFGRSFPVEIIYKKPLTHEQVWDAAARELEANRDKIGEGSVLIFMPGAYEITKTIEAIIRRNAFPHFEVLPLHGSLTTTAQDNAINGGSQKIIVSTNVAETSLTIPDVKLVIDSGLVRVLRFDARRGLNTLFVEPVSAESAEQRAGRAGRLAAGTCVRLWGKFEESARVQRLMPEIHRIDLSEAILGIIALYGPNVNTFPWVEAPHATAIESAMNLLHTLRATNKNGIITETGIEMASLGIHPRWTRMLIDARKNDCIASAAVIAALAQLNGIFSHLNDEVIIRERMHKFADQGSDLITELNAWIWAGQQQFNTAQCRQYGINVNTARQVGRLAIQILNRVQSAKSYKKLPEGVLTMDEAEKLRFCIFSAFVDFLAVRHNLKSPVCQLMNGRSGKLTPLSYVNEAKFMVATELEENKTAQGVILNLKKVTAVNEEWLENVIGDTIEYAYESYYDENLKRARRICRGKYNGIEISFRYEEITDDDEASEILAKAIIDGKIEFSQWNDDVEHFIRRANFAANNAPQYNLPQITANDKLFIIRQAIYKCRSYKEIAGKQIWPALKSWYSNEQLAAIDYLAPVTVNMPRRKYPIKLRYDEKGDVVLSETVQAFYDFPPLYVAEGKVQVVYELLAPSRRVVQITRNLEYFWKNSYIEIKKELKARYPKHEWR